MHNFLDASPSPSGPIFFIFMQFSENLAKYQVTPSFGKSWIRRWIGQLCMSFYSGEQESEFYLPEQCLFCGSVLYYSKWDICERKYSKFNKMELLV